MGTITLRSERFRRKPKTSRRDLTDAVRTLATKVFGHVPEKLTEEQKSSMRRQTGERED